MATTIEPGSQSDPAPVVHSWRWRILLFLCLIPLFFVEGMLARLPGPTYGFINPGHGEFTMTFLTWNPGGDCHFELLSLQTGLTKQLHGQVHFVGKDVVITRQGPSGSCQVKQLDPVTFEETLLGTFDANGNHPWFQFIAPGIVSMISLKDELVVVDVPTGRTTKVPLPPRRQGQTGWYLSSGGKQSRIVVREVRKDYLSCQHRLLLYSYSEGELDELAEWPGSLGTVCVDDKIYSVSEAYDLEVRRISDGSLIETQPLFDKLKIPATDSVQFHPVDAQVARIATFPTPLFSYPGRHVAYDLQRQRIVVDRMVKTIPGFSDANERWLAYGNEYVIEIWGLEDRKLNTHIDLPALALAAKFTGDGRRLIVQFWDQSVRLYDVVTGKHLRTWRSRAWETPTFILLLIGFVIWGCLWVWLGWRAGWPPLADAVVLNLLVLNGLFLPILLQNDSHQATLPEARGVYLYCEALIASWIAFLALWFMFVRARWPVRLSVFTLGLAMVLLLGHLSSSRGTQEMLDSKWRVISILAWLSGMMWIARRRGWQLIDPRPVRGLESVRAESRQVSLRDLFLLTATVAILLAIIRGVVPLPVPSASDMMAIVLMAFVTAACAGVRRRNLFLVTATAIGLLAIIRGRVPFLVPSPMTAIVLLAFVTALCAGAGIWSALSPRHWAVRFAVLLIVVTAATILHAGLHKDPTGGNAWLLASRFPFTAAGFTCASLLIFRLRGWYLQRNVVSISLATEV